MKRMHVGSAAAIAVLFASLGQRGCRGAPAGRYDRRLDRRPDPAGQQGAGAGPGRRRAGQRRRRDQGRAPVRLGALRARRGAHRAPASRRRHPGLRSRRRRPQRRRPPRPLTRRVGPRPGPARDRTLRRIPARLRKLRLPPPRPRHRRRPPLAPLRRRLQLPHPRPLPPTKSPGNPPQQSNPHAPVHDRSVVRARRSVRSVGNHRGAPRATPSASAASSAPAAPFASVGNHRHPSPAGCHRPGPQVPRPSPLDALHRACARERHDLGAARSRSIFHRSGVARSTRPAAPTTPRRRHFPIRHRTPASRSPPAALTPPVRSSPRPACGERSPRLRGGRGAAAAANAAGPLPVPPPRRTAGEGKRATPCKRRGRR